MMNTIIRTIKDINSAVEIADYTDLIGEQIVDADSVSLILEKLNREFDSAVLPECIIDNIKTPLDIYDAFSNFELM